MSGDGNTAMFCGFHGETYNCPAEINEARNGLIVDRMTLNTEPGGEGRHAGGRGIVLDYRVRADDGFPHRGLHPVEVPAVGCGRRGATARRTTSSSSARTASGNGLPTCPDWPPGRDDVIRVFTGSGGGLRRSPRAGPGIGSRRRAQRPGLAGTRARRVREQGGRRRRVVIGPHGTLPECRDAGRRTSAPTRSPCRVIQAGIRAAAEEMFATLRKTAMSPIIYEVLDVGTGVTDGAGNLADSGAGIPTFVGVLDKAVRRIIEVASDSDIVAGDIFVTNDPSFGGG